MFGNYGMQQSNIVWVNGEAGANAYPVPPGCSMQLMDRENPVFYIKTVDPSGMPQKLRKFHYNEEIQQETPNGNFVSRDEFNKLMEQLAALNRELGIGTQAEVKNNG